MLRFLLAFLLIPNILFAAPPDQVDFLIGGLTDSSGQPLAGGKVYTYSAGTTTNKTTYQDYAQTTPHANPIVLDSQGKKQVYAEGNYKFRIDNSADTTQYTLDNLRFGSVGAADFVSTYYLPTISVSAPFTFTSTTIFTSQYFKIGKLVLFTVNFSGTAGGTVGSIIDFTLPITSSGGVIAASAVITDNSTVVSGTCGSISSTQMRVRKYDAAAYTAGTVNIVCYGFYESAS